MNSKFSASKIYISTLASNEEGLFWWGGAYLGQVLVEESALNLNK